MTNLRIIFSCIALFLLFHGCSKILEPVALVGGKKGAENENTQENFEVKIISLTFDSARDANKLPYQRWLMRSGVGSVASVIDEAELLVSKMPVSAEGTEYLLGPGDKLIYTQLNEFVTTGAQLPTQPRKIEYLLGIGDELTLIQLNEAVNSEVKIDQNIDQSQLSKGVMKTSSLVGTDGNILLLGLGSIEAENRSLKSVQTEVRNILIRNGLAPNFQLEITGFNSKKAFVTFPKSEQTSRKNVVPVTNLSVTLKELIINYGLRSSSKDTTIVSLTRDGETFRMTASQMFDMSSPRIVIKDGDQIEIDEVEIGSMPVEAVVGSQGNILIPGIGRIKAKNRTLTEVQTDLARIIAKKGLVPNFQLEITDFNSKKFFIITENNGSKSVPLNSSKLALKTAALSHISAQENKKNFYEELIVIEMTRKGISYQMTLRDIVDGKAQNVFIQDNDTIEIKNFKYKPGQVFTLSGRGNAEVVPIAPSRRETLADILFSENGALSKASAKRSEIYLLRGRNPSVAYHLDAQNVSRILVAAKTELRPNDIVFVADRPIISFAQVLKELSPITNPLDDYN